MRTHITPLPHYGVHTDEKGIAYLYQDICPTGWEFLGINRRSTSTVKHLRNQCPHQINVHLATRVLSTKIWREFLRLSNDPLIQAMLPIPNGKTYHFDQTQLDNPIEWLSCIERLCSPLHTCVKPIWADSNTLLQKKIGMTNIHPLVLTDIGETEVMFARRLHEISKTSPRTLVLSSKVPLVMPSTIEPIITNIDSLTSLKEFISLPLEHIGSYIVASYCKGNLNLSEAAN